MTAAIAVIDLNSINGDGTTRVRLANLSRPVEPGDDVIVREPEDDITGRGTIARVSSGYFHILVDRASLQ